VASVPSLPGCMSQGETFEETKKSIQDAIQGYLDVLREDGEDIPRESEERVVGSVTAPEPV